MTGFPKPRPKALEAQARRRASDLALRKARQTVLQRDGGCCRCCGRPAYETHHVVYRSHGGGHDVSNLISVDVRCHRALHNHTLKVIGNDAASARFEWVEAPRG